MALNIKNLLSGVARFYIGAAANATTPDVMPLDSIGMGVTWGGTWADVGYTQDGVRVMINQTYNAITADQQLNPVLHIRTAVEEQIQTTLIESTLDNIKFITGRGTIATTAASGTPARGNRELTLAASNALQYVALGFEGQAPPNDKALPRRIMLPLCLATGNVEVGQVLTDISKMQSTFMRVGGSEGNPKIRDVTDA
jgi:hypothetical protein